jgi:hypothetical protein
MGLSVENDLGVSLRLDEQGHLRLPAPSVCQPGGFEAETQPASTGSESGWLQTADGELTAPFHGEAGMSQLDHQLPRAR